MDYMPFNYIQSNTAGPQCTILTGFRHGDEAWRVIEDSVLSNSIEEKDVACGIIETENRDRDSLLFSRLRPCNLKVLSFQ